MDEKWMTNRGCVQAWLTQAAARGDVEEVKRRLEQVPEPMREAVRAHARAVFALREK